MWPADFRSYGSVYKSLHKESGQVLAIKQVPVDTDLQEIIKEISIMQQCDSPYIVKYYGSYFKNTDLWVSIWSYPRSSNLCSEAALDGVYKTQIFIQSPCLIATLRGYMNWFCEEPGCSFQTLEGRSPIGYYAAFFDTLIYMFP